MYIHICIYLFCELKYNSILTILFHDHARHCSPLPRRLANLTKDTPLFHSVDPHFEMPFAVIGSIGLAQPPWVFLVLLHFCVIDFLGKYYNSRMAGK